jgi:eukaryotic-like serine/threonine-protein kinase
MMPTNSTSTQQASNTRLNTPPVTDYWRQFEEQLLDGRFPLNKYAGSFQSGALFLSELDGREQQRVVVKLVSAAASDAQALAASWSIAHSLQHPNIVRVYAAAQGSLGGLRVVYAVSDYAEESLDSILEERCLTESEARELLEASARALGFLHSKGLLQGSLEPSAIVAVGEAIMLVSDHLVPVPEGRALRRELRSYDSPEVITAGLSPASDVWALGAILYQALTRRLPAGPDQAAMLALPQPFAGILPNCLATDPGQRWTPRSIVTALAGARPEFTPVAGQAAPPKIATLLPTASRTAWWKIAIAALAVVLLFVAWLAMRSPSRNRASAAIPQAASPVKPVQQAPLASQPAPMSGRVSPFTPPASQPRLGESPARARQRTIWRVVVYTYSTAAEAEKKVAAINRRWPDLHATVFSPADHPPVLVVVGGTMDRDAATQLRRRVLAAGFPSDTYISNYSR